MATRFTLPHIDITGLHSAGDYQGGGSGRGSSAVRIREEHGRRLLNELNASLAAADAGRPTDDRLPPATGGYVEVELRRGTSPDILERRRSGLAPRASKDENDARTVALFVPDEARSALAAILQDYMEGPLTGRDNPPNKSTVEPIEAFRQARLETLWTDEADALPQNAQDEMWWAVWVARSDEARLEGICQRLDVRAAARDRRLYFPEVAVVPVHATRAAIELMLFATGVIVELRRATDNPVFFTDNVRDTQHEWSDDFAERVMWPGTDVPAICIFDTGVTRGHALIEPALAATDAHAIEPDWGTDDHDDHGTAMAGLALHGDLTAPLASQDVRTLAHRLESVKVLPPDGFDPNDPGDYGAITQAAVARPEIAVPERKRVYCMAVTNDSVAGSKPSIWSSAIDQACAGTMPGDDGEAPNRRLFVLSAGNTEPVLEAAQWHGQDAYPAEDPSQAWNALTIGGYTDLIEITDNGYEGWTPMAGVGGLSPHSRTSVGWMPGRSPFKPELVLEGGNRGVSPSRAHLTNLESLGLLSTGREPARPLVPFAATSAATAQAARMAAQLTAEHPDCWPETIRALMIHSAEYTDHMRAAFTAQPQLRERYAIVRRFGYGVPDFDRANASARDHLALIAQTSIQPFKLDKTRRFNECHYYPLPMPNRVLEELDNERVQLKITLSYFIDPNPGLSANIDPQRYQSFGLRFDLRRKGELLDNFKRRVNAGERDNPRLAGPRHPDDPYWLLGPDSVSAGSLHSDSWTGPAVDLLGRDTLCIKPVGGWWRDRAAAAEVDQMARYALIVTLKAPRVEVDLYTPIVQAMVAIPAAEIETDVFR
jgi:hypothetical protein